MSESRVSELLKRSRSRHEVVISKELRKVSADYQNQKAKSREANESLRKMMSEMRYFQSLNKRIQKGVSSRKKQLSGVKSIRQRYIDDLKKKEKLEALRQQEIRKNQSLASKIKQQRNKRLNAVKKSIFEKEMLGDYYRSQKSRLRDERDSLYEEELNKNKKRVETIVEFECNLSQSYVRRKESSNSQFIRMYRQAIEDDRKTVELKRVQTVQMKEKLQSLTEGTARRLAKMNEIVSSIKKYKPLTPGSRSPLNFNKQKLMQKSRCYTQTSSLYENPNTHDSSLFISHHHTDNHTSH